MSFNLDAPPGFRGLHPDLPVRTYHRNLPHWRQDGATYFVTFNLEDAVPTPKKNELASMRRDWEAASPFPLDEEAWQRWAKLSFTKVEKWMDKGYGKCWWRQRKYADELQRSILHFQDNHYEIGCLAIMPNHCHVVIRPFENTKLEDELGAIKSVTSKFVNKHESLGGANWQQESYDRIIRDAEHLYRVVQYIGNNPRKAGLPPSQRFRWINPAWQAVGWRFED